MTARKGAKDRLAGRGADVGDVLGRVAALARNLWWTWHPDPQRLFAGLDPALWEATNHNPLKTLAALSDERRATLREDVALAALLRTCERQLAEYLRARTWFQRKASATQKRARIAYFCAEYGLHESLPIYAGGLGVLAGDHLKSASDLGIPLVAVGLLYRQGYYRQELRADGTTHVVYPQHDFGQLPVCDTGRTIRVPLGHRTVQAKIWLVQVGRVPLYLLDTDVPGNAPRDRVLTQRLYGGDQDTRIRQEILLGMGGVRALAALGMQPTVFHMNEGHAAFCTLERYGELRRGGMSHERAVQRIRASSVFTTHTPVAAGHDRFPPALMTKYFGPRLDDLQLTRTQLLGLGREKPQDAREPFCMTVLALRLAERCNGVSKLHGQVSREMWTSVFGTTDPKRVPIGHITNGVHAETWLSPVMRPLYDKYLKPRWVGAGPDDNWWARAEQIPPAELWATRRLLRRQLVDFVRLRLRQQIERRCAPVAELIAALDTFDEDTLTIGFARRFATYKRAPLIFSDPQRLAAIVGDARRPVQLVFAGKAHPADREGQDFARRVYTQARAAGLRGRVVLLEDYDMHVGRLLTSGCDVWLNNPIRPMEASGTSGMKPPLHGGLNCSLLDGWWPEACDGRNGWAIPESPARSAARRDREDAATVYTLLEREIVPLFYDRGRDGVPRRWVQRMTASLRTVCSQFNTHRMLAEYLELYAPGK